MGDVKVTWNGSDIIDLSASGSKTIKTGGKFNEYDMTLQYTKPAGSTDFVVTLSKSNGDWVPDRTFAEIAAAGAAGKTIITVSDHNDFAVVWGNYSSGEYDYEVHEYEYNPDRLHWYYYILDSGGLTLDSDGYTYDPWDADAVAANVANGKVFYTSTGRDVGTYTPPSPSYQTKSVDPSLSAQAITADNGYDALAQVNISAITAALLASLDADFVAGNIKSGVDLFGLVGSYTGGGGDLKIFEKLAIDSFTNSSSQGGTVSHSLGEVPNFVLASVKTPIIPENGSRYCQMAVYSATASSLHGGTYQQYLQLYGGYYKNNNASVSTFAIQAASSWGIDSLTSTQLRIRSPAQLNYPLPKVDFWLLTGIIKPAYVTPLPT